MVAVAATATAATEYKMILTRAAHSLAGPIDCTASSWKRKTFHHSTQDVFSTSLEEREPKQIRRAESNASMYTSYSPFMECALGNDCVADLVPYLADCPRSIRAFSPLYHFVPRRSTENTNTSGRPSFHRKMHFASDDRIQPWSANEGGTLPSFG